MNEEVIAKKKRVYKVLVVDDEKDIVEALKWTLERAEEFDCDVTTATNPLIAMTDLESTEFNIVLADFKMPIMDGVELLTQDSLGGHGSRGYGAVSAKLELVRRFDVAALRDGGGGEGAWSEGPEAAGLEGLTLPWTSPKA